MKAMRSKYLDVVWGDYSWTVRKWRFRHNRRVRSMYLQVGSLEVVVWYR